jgi:hypothetical protein
MGILLLCGWPNGIREVSSEAATAEALASTFLHRTTWFRKASYLFGNNSFMSMHQILRKEKVQNATRCLRGFAKFNFDITAISR